MISFSSLPLLPLSPWLWSGPSVNNNSTSFATPVSSMLCDHHLQGSSFSFLAPQLQRFCDLTQGLIRHHIPVPSSFLPAFLCLKFPDDSALSPHTPHPFLSGPCLVKPIVVRAALSLIHVCASPAELWLWSWQPAWLVCQVIPLCLLDDYFILSFSLIF